MAKMGHTCRCSYPICNAVSSTRKRPLQILTDKMCALHATSCAGQFDTGRRGRIAKGEVQHTNCDVNINENVQIHKTYG